MCVNVCGHICLCVCVCLCVKSEIFIMCLPVLPSTLYIEKGSLVELETGDSDNLASQFNSGTFSCPQSTGITTKLPCPLL